VVVQAHARRAYVGASALVLVVAHKNAITTSRIMNRMRGEGWVG
jgi:hypothetical protein